MSAASVVLLPGTGGPRDEHEPLGEIAEVLYLLTQPHLLRGANLVGDHPEHPHSAVAVTARVAAETCQAFDLVRPVRVSPVPEFPDLLGRHNAEEHVLDPLGRERGLVCRATAVDPQHGRLVAPQMKVGGARLNQGPAARPCSPDVPINPGSCERRARVMEEAVRTEPTVKAEAPQREVPGAGGASPRAQ